MPSLKSVVISLIAGGGLLAGAGVTYAAYGEPGPERARVVRVIDGDTLVARYDGADRTIRLLNVDAPESKHPAKPVECLAVEATSFLEERLQPGDKVRLEFDVDLKDRYDRELAGVFEDDVLINAEVARYGLGVPVIFEPNRKFYDEVLKAYEEAKGNQVGMFSLALTCTFNARIEQYDERVTRLEAEATTLTLEEAQTQSDELYAEGTALLALITQSTPDTLDAAGLSQEELDALGQKVAGLQQRTEGVSKAAVERDREAKEKAAAEKKAREEAAKKAEEARKAAEKAEQERKAAEKAEQERKAAEKAAREAEAAARAEAERQAEEQRQREEAARRAAPPAAPQPLVPQHPAPQPQPQPEPAPPANVWYDNCTAVRAAGAAPIFAGQPGYGRHLDRDGDGVGCE